MAWTRSAKNILALTLPYAIVSATIIGAERVHTAKEAIPILGNAAGASPTYLPFQTAATGMCSAPLSLYAIEKCRRERGDVSENLGWQMESLRQSLR